MKKAKVVTESGMIIESSEVVGTPRKLIVNNNFHIVGLDYSVNSPGVASIKINKKFEPKNLNVIIFNTEKKKTNWEYENLTRYFIKPKYENSIIKFDFMSDKIMEHIDDSDVVGIEGYSFGSKGQGLTSIHESTGLMKYKLWKRDILFNVFAPKLIKKFASDNGNANKPKMLEAANKFFKIDLMKYYNIKANDKVIYDIVDSIWICKYIYDEVKNNKFIEKYSF